MFRFSFQICNYTKGQKKKYPPRGTVHMIVRIPATTNQTEKQSALPIWTQPPRLPERRCPNHRPISIPTDPMLTHRKYGNGCCCGIPPRFPDPRFRCLQKRQCALALCAMICVYSFVTIIIPHHFVFCKRGACVFPTKTLTHTKRTCAAERCDYSSSSSVTASSLVSL